MDKNAGSHLPKGTAVSADKVTLKGPVPMHHLTKLGHGASVMKNPFGNGAVSTTSKIGNGGKGNY